MERFRDLVSYEQCSPLELNGAVVVDVEAGRDPVAFSVLTENNTEEKMDTGSTSELICYCCGGPGTGLLGATDNSNLERDNECMLFVPRTAVGVPITTSEKKGTRSPVRGWIS